MIDPSMFGGGGAPAGPPQSIQIPGGDSGGDPTSMMEEVKSLLDRIIQVEPDHEDKLLIEKMLTEAQQYLASQQKLEDTATGVGPGAKLLRKKSPSPSQGY